MRKRDSVFGVIAIVAIASSLAFAARAVGSQPGNSSLFDVNDMAYLWPIPKDPKDVEDLISAAGRTPGGVKLWPDDVFDLLLSSAQETTVDSIVSTSKITFEPFAEAFQKPATWKLVSFRFDPSAPGGHAGTTSRFGSTPQLRLVFQPITVSGTSITVHDYTAHLAFSYVKPSPDPSKGVPDEQAVRTLVAELGELKRAAAGGGAPATGALRVHPALAAKVPGFADKIVGFLERNSQRGRLTDLAFMGIEPPEPWIFFAMRRRQSDGAFVRVGPKALVGRQAQMLSFVGGDPVVPEPSPFNEISDAPGGATGQGVSTAPLFRRNAKDLLLSPVFPGTGRPLLRDVPDIIANPERSNVFNTDCVSCHTESTRRQLLKISGADAAFAYRQPQNISGVDVSHLPTSVWNVRNFGWFHRGAAVQATITQRTANEAAEAVEFVNHTYLSSAKPPSVVTERKSPNVERSAPMEPPVASPLTLVMTIKEGETDALRQDLERMQRLPAEQNPITRALNKLGTVHFARFVFLNERQLAVITTYDGSFEEYINAFVREIGGVFDAILAHVDGAPPTPVGKPENRQPFLEYVRRNDLNAIPPFYSAYPNLKVRDILTLEKKAGG